MLGFALAGTSLAQVEVLTIPHNGEIPIANPQGTQQLQSAGDVNHDGIEDLLWSTFDQVAVRDGSTGTVLFTVADGAYGYPFVETALRGIGLGDVNGDGCPDFAVGAGGDTTSGTMTGAVRLYSGLDGTLLATRLGPAFHLLGIQIAAAGDLNLDGIPDLVAACRADWNHNEELGSAAWALSCDPSDFATFHVIESPGPGVGVSVGAVGDFDANGAVDFGVEFNHWDYHDNTINIYDGLDEHILCDLAAGADHPLGPALGPANDVDSDGYADLYIGSYLAYSAYSNYWSGTFEIYSGRTRKRWLLRDGTGPNSLMGLSAENLGDIDGDGAADFLVTEGLATTPQGPAAGRVHIFTKNGSRRLATSLEGTHPSQVFGYVACRVGDVNGDSVDEVAVLDPFVESPHGMGVVRVFSLAGLEPEPKRFVPGSELWGDIVTSDYVAESSLDALSGTKLKLALHSETADFVVRIEVVGPDGKTLKSWKAHDGSKSTLKIKKSGVHTLRVRSLGALGLYELKTSAVIPKKVVEWFDEPVAGIHTIHHTIHAVGGSQMILDVLGHSNAIDKTGVKLVSEFGDVIDLMAFDQGYRDEVYTHPFPFPRSGRYRLDVPLKNPTKPGVVSITREMAIIHGRERICIDD